MTNAEILWDCPKCGRALISGDSCPRCGSMRSAVLPVTAPSVTIAQPSKSIFVLDPAHRDFLAGRAKYVIWGDRPWASYVIACWYGALALGFVLQVGFALKANLQGLWSALLLAAFSVAAAGSYIVNEPGRRLRRAAAAKRQIIQGQVIRCVGTWVKPGYLNSKWEYRIEVHYRFTQNGIAKNGLESNTRKDLAVSDPPGFQLFGGREPSETSETNDWLPAPGTPVAILLLDAPDRFMIL